ncbi:MAG: glycosyltransferase [Planctomycetota bacterium]
MTAGPRIRVALVIPTMDRGGAEKQLVLLASGLPRDEFDVRVFLLTRDGPRSEDLRRAGVPYEVIGKRFKGDVSALWRLRRAFKTFQADIVHTWLFAANSFGRVAAMWAGIPTRIAAERSVDPWKSGWQHRLDRYLAKSTHAVVTNSHGVVDFYAEHGHDPNQFVVIPNGIPAVDEVNAKPISRAEAASRLNVDASHRWIVAVGRLWPQKNYRDLIWAGELIGTLRQDTTLIIVGDGPQKGELMRHRDALTTKNRVCFVGQRDDVESWLPHADAFWNASSYEGQSNALIEAMRAGVPVVASDIAGNRDLVVPGETGALFPPGDTAELVRKTQAIWETPDQAEAMGQAAQNRITTHFSVDQMVARYTKLYRDVAARSTHPKSR